MRKVINTWSLCFLMALNIIILTCMTTAYAEDVTQPVYVDASDMDQRVTVGNVDADHFGVHVRAENGHTADVNAGNVTAGFVENLDNAGLYVFASGSGSLANVTTKDLTAAKEVNNYGAKIVVVNGGNTVINTGRITGWTGVDVTAEGNNSSAIIKTGDLDVSQYGLLFQSNDYAEIEVTAGNILALADGIFNPYFAMAGNGGKVQVTTKNVVSRMDFGVGGFASGTDSELSLITNDISAEYIGMDLSAESQGKVSAEAKNVTINSSDTDPYSPNHTRRCLGGHSTGNGSDLEFRISGSVILKEIGDNCSMNEPPSEGVLSTVSENGKSTVSIGKGVTVNSEKTCAAVSGIRAENTGGKIMIAAGADVSAEVPGGSDTVYGLYIINDASRVRETERLEPLDLYPDPAEKALLKTSEESRTEISVTGDLTGSAYGLYLESSDEVMTDVLVTGTISGKTAGVLVSDNTTPENFDLTVWRIEEKNGCVAVDSEGSCAEEIEADIKYIIAVSDPKDAGFITDQNGDPLEKSHGYPAAKAGSIVCLGKNSGVRDRSRNCLAVPSGGGVRFSAGNTHAPDFYWVMNDDGMLPNTGFPRLKPFTLPMRSAGLAYEKTGLTLQIPSLDVAEAIVTVPKVNGNYPVEWLERNIGRLAPDSGSEKALTVLTGHNHLNTSEAGPFLFLGKLMQGDRIFLSDSTGNAQVFQVYANRLITPDGFEGLADVLREDSLVLLTCEDESLNGSYLHRRVILAFPLSSSPIFGE